MSILLGLCSDSYHTALPHVEEYCHIPRMAEADRIDDYHCSIEHGRCNIWFIRPLGASAAGQSEYGPVEIGYNGTIEEIEI